MAGVVREQRSPQPRVAFDSRRPASAAQHAIRLSLGRSRRSDRQAMPGICASNALSSRSGNPCPLWSGPQGVCAKSTERARRSSAP